MRHVLGSKQVACDRMGARCGELNAPRLSWAASPAATKGGAAASVACVPAEQLNEPRASGQEAGSYTRVFEGRII